ncbi:unnamed protein product, partial [Didymodactylos carnosus]
DKYERICPGFGFIRSNGPCNDTCVNDTDCVKYLKCCYSPAVTPCGYHYHECKKSCTAKCCPNACGSLICIEPAK